VEFEAFSINKEKWAIVEIVVRADRFFAVVLEIGLETLQLSRDDLDNLIGSEPIQFETIKTLCKRFHVSFFYKVDKRIAEICMRFMIHREIKEIKLHVKSSFLDLL